jgi:sortase B
MKKRKLKWLNLILLISVLIFSGLFVFSATQTIKWLIDNKANQKLIDSTSKITAVKEVADNSKTEIIVSEEEIDPESLYWQYIKVKLIDVDLTALKEINKSTKGWLVVPGTNVNYPFVQTKNNTYYLNHSFDKSLNSAGWVFLDYRNKLDTLDQNTIIYAHGRKDNTMFGTLKNTIKNSWFKNSSNHIIKISTAESNTLWQIFSIYIIDTTSDYLITNFNNDADYTAFLDKIKLRSINNFDTTVNSDDHIITLSTCYNQKEKLVVHAKLIKKETK